MSALYITVADKTSDDVSTLFADFPAISLVFSFLFLVLLFIPRYPTIPQDAGPRVQDIRCAAECPCEPSALPQCKGAQNQLCRQKRCARPPVRAVSFTLPPLTVRRQFLRQHAPALAYANPLLPIAIHRIPDPRSKHKDPNSPDRDAVKLGRWGGVPDGLQLGSGNVPGGEMVVEFRTFCLCLAASGTDTTKRQCPSPDTPVSTPLRPADS